MKSGHIALDLFLISSYFVLAQQQPEVVAGEPTVTATEPAKPALPESDLPFKIEKPSQVKFPLQLARRIYEETLQEVRWHLNPGRPTTVVLNLTVRLGQKTEQVHTEHFPTRSTVISLSDWNEVTFARLLSRAVRDCMLTDKELDDLAVSALRRARATVSVQTLHEQQSVQR